MRKSRTWKVRGLDGAIEITAVPNDPTDADFRDLASYIVIEPVAIESPALSVSQALRVAKCIARATAFLARSAPRRVGRAKARA